MNHLRLVAWLTPYLRCEAKAVLADRGLLITDLCMATLIPLAIQLVIWKIVYADGKTLHGFDFRLLMTYFIYVIALGRLNNGYDIVQRLSDAVLNGTVESFSIRPLPYPVQLFSIFIGGSAPYLGLILLALLADLIWQAGNVPISGFALVFCLLGYVLVLFLSICLCFLVALSIGVIAFWFKRPDFLLSLLLLAQTTLGGQLLPPTFWSGWLQPIMEYNPFRYIIATPATVLQSWNLAITYGATLPLSLNIAVFFLLARFMWRLAIKNYHGAGG